LQSTDAHRAVLERLSADLIAGRGTLPEAADLLADFSRRRTGEWLRGVGRRYPGRSEEAVVAASLVYFTLFRLHDGDPQDEAAARRLAADAYPSGPAEAAAPTIDVTALPEPACPANAENGSASPAEGVGIR
jgi:hypothetical protein